MSKQSDLVSVSQGASGDPLFIDTENNRVGVGTSLPLARLQASTAGTSTTPNTNVVARFVTNGSDADAHIQLSNGVDHSANIGIAGGANLYFATDGAERMRIDSAGRVTMPYQPHIFGSPTNTGGSGIANSFTPQFSQGGLAFVTDRITVPVAGLYSISFNSICNLSTGRVDSLIYINGTVVMQQLNEDNGTGYHYRSASAVLKLQAGDYIQFLNNDWFDATNTAFQNWRTASVTLIG